jgi:hypothetical protein
MAKQTQSEKHQTAIETIVGSFKLNINGVYPQDDGSSIQIDTDGNMNDVPVKWITKMDESGKPEWVVGVF